jgi:hypothetical protein
MGPVTYPVRKIEEAGQGRAIDPRPNPARIMPAFAAAARYKDTQARET